MAQIPIAIWLADKLEDPESTHGYRLVANNAANELRRLYVENQSLKAQRKPLTEDQTRAAYRNTSDSGHLTSHTKWQTWRDAVAWCEAAHKIT